MYVMHTPEVATPCDDSCAPCRFDVRALLDFYKEPDPRVLAARHKSHEELKLEEVRLDSMDFDTWA